MKRFSIDDAHEGLSHVRLEEDENGGLCKVEEAEAAIEAAREEGRKEALSHGAARVVVEVIGGVEGACLAVSGEGAAGGTRVAGPKPWGGGSVEKTWVVDADQLLDDIVSAASSAKVARYTRGFRVNMADGRSGKVRSMRWNAELDTFSYRIAVVGDTPGETVLAAATEDELETAEKAEA